jgi:ABC-type glutathione transport system ATPase component
MNSLNPVMRIREQILDGVSTHRNGSGTNVEKQVAERFPELLATVGLTPNVLNLYPHELSGGMKQRVCIAISISLNPKVIIADEPTSALDVVVQRQIIQTLNNVQKRLNAAILLVGHDMGLMAQFVDRIGVMYGGRMVEIGSVRDIFKEPRHPYTLYSAPDLESAVAGDEGDLARYSRCAAVATQPTTRLCVSPPLPDGIPALSLGDSASPRAESWPLGRVSSVLIGSEHVRSPHREAGHQGLRPRIERDGCSRRLLPIHQ